MRLMQMIIATCWGRAATALVLFVALGLSLTAQAVVDNMRDRFGVVFERSLNFHAAAFKQLPNVDNCCPVFESGNGTGFNIGLVYDLPLSRRWSMSFVLDRTQHDAELIAEESADVYDLQTNSLSVATIEHSIRTSFSSFGLSFLAQINPVARLRFQAGLRLSALSSIHFEQVEQMRSEGFVFKENMQRKRNEKSGDIPQATGLQQALVIGSSYEFALNTTRTLLLAPELSLNIGLTNLSPNIDWKANVLRLGMALKFATPPMPVEPASRPTDPQQVPQRTTASTTPNLKSDIQQDLRQPRPSLRLEDSKGVTLDSVDVEEYRGQSVQPLLNYVFFDEGSSTIPQRYSLLNAEAVTAYRPDLITRESSLSHYYDLLNIVAWRMRQNPRMHLTLTGCVADVGVERENLSLSRQRASSLKDYLTRVWKIHADRIQVEARALPLNPSRATESSIASDAENRRVELSSADADILEPLVLSDTSYRCVPDTLVLVVKRPAGMMNRGEVLLENDESARMRLKLGNDTSQRIRIPVSARFLRSTSWLQARFEDAKNHSSPQLNGKANDVSAVAAEESAMIPVHFRSIQRKAELGVQDSVVDKVRLILFDYDKSGLSAANKRIVLSAQKRIQPGSRVVVEGYSDELGDAQYNQRLSEERARQSAAALQQSVSSVVGRGESAEFPNSLPEGRFYNRSVSLTITSPAVRP